MQSFKISSFKFYNRGSQTQSKRLAPELWDESYSHLPNKNRIGIKDTMSKFELIVKRHDGKVPTRWDFWELFFKTHVGFY